MDKTYYKAEEAAKILKRSIASFHRDVNAGLVPYEYEEGSTRKKYPKEAIDTLARRKHKPQPGRMKLTFQKTTIAHLWIRQQSSVRLYGEDDTVTYERALEWNDINDEMCMDALDNGRLIGAVTFMPLEEAVAHALLEDRMREKDIPDRAIKLWTDSRLSVYIPTIEIIPSGDSEIDGERGAFLLRRTIKWAIQLAMQYDIKNWYAIGATPEGQTILEALGFTKLVELDGGARNGYILAEAKKPTKLMNMIMAHAERHGLLPLPKSQEE